MRPAPIPHVQVSARLLQEHVNHPSPARPGAAASRAALAAGLVGSIALVPVAWAQGIATRRRVPLLPPALPPHHGRVPGVGAPIRIVAIGDSAVSGIGVLRADQTVAAATARALTCRTGRPSIWRTYGLSGATVRDALSRLLPRVTPEPADLLIIAFGVNDATGYRSPAGFADDLARLAGAARDRIGQAAVVIGGVAPLGSFPALPWPLRTVLGWRSAALQAAADRIAGRLPRTRRGAIRSAARSGPVRLRRLSPQSESAHAVGRKDCSAGAAAHRPIRHAQHGCGRKRRSPPLIHKIRAAFAGRHLLEQSGGNRSPPACGQRAWS